MNDKKRIIIEVRDGIDEKEALLMVLQAYGGHFALFTDGCQVGRIDNKKSVRYVVCKPGGVK